MSRKHKFSKPLKKQTLSEQVAEAVRESILNGDWQAGQALSTEPELAQQFEVSRAVIRDATRMLDAQGLVEVRHGRGVFVTESPLEAFGDALLLALRRQSATAWDVEQFETLLLPELCVLAGQEATEAELAQIKELSEAYLDLFSEIVSAHWGQIDLAPQERQRLRASSRAFYQAIADASHNRLMQLIIQPLTSLRNLRDWDIPEQSLEMAIKFESAYFRRLTAAIASRDPQETRRQVKELMALPAEAVEAMQQTPVGEVTKIVIEESSPWAKRLAAFNQD